MRNRHRRAEARRQTQPRRRPIVRRMELRVKYAVLLLLFAGCATVPAPKPNRIDQLINTPPFNRAVWGIDVEDDDGHVIYSLNAHRLEMPASNRKLFSA